MDDVDDLRSKFQTNEWNEREKSKEMVSQPENQKLVSGSVRDFRSIPMRDMQALGILPFKLLLLQQQQQQQSLHATLWMWI